MNHSPSKTRPDIPEIFTPPYPFDLPIMEWRERIVAAVQEHQVLVIIGETGSGKSTQIPKFCMEAGRGRSGMIGCTQPRRIAQLNLPAVCPKNSAPGGRPW